MSKIVNLLKQFIFYMLCFMSLGLLALFFSLFGTVVGQETKHKIANAGISLTIWLVKILFGISFKVENQSLLPSEPYVLMANHQSSLETFYLQLLCHPVSAVLKKELLQLPIINRAFKIGEPIPLDRSKPTKAYRDLLKQGQQRLKSGRSVLIFPEGTRVKPGESVRLNRGAASLAHLAKVPLVPVVHNAGLHWPPKGGRIGDKTITVRVGKHLDGSSMTVAALYQSSSDWLFKNRDQLLEGANQHKVNGATEQGLRRTSL